MNGRRPVVRWAWRMFRREWRQQLGVLVLMTVAVAAAVGGAAMASAAGTHEGRVGDAKALVRIDNTDPARAEQMVAAAGTRFGAIDVVRHASSAVPGSPQRLDVRSQDPEGRFSRALLALRSGRYPTAAGEVALTDGAVSLLGARLGATVTLDGAERTVVGTVENPADLHDEFALLEPDSDAPADTLVLLAERDGREDPPRADTSTTAASPGSDREPSVPPFQVETFGNEHDQVVAMVVTIDTLAMALVCLVAAAGFVVVAQRRQRQLGLLAAIGATDRHLRLVMVVNGVIVGLAAALGGGLLGLVGWAAFQPAVERAVSHRVDTLHLPWGLIAECLAAAVVAATAAAWWPARTMSKVPVMAALSRRPLPPLPVRRSLASALLLLALGVAALVYADPNDDPKPLFIIGGVVLLIVGMVLAAPGAVRLAAAPAARLPLAPRLALRDLARHQARAAAALAAITLGLGISVLVVALANASVYDAAEGNLAANQLVVRIDGAGSTRPTDQTDADRRTADAHADEIAAAVPGATLSALDLAFDPAAIEAGLPEPVRLAERVGPHTSRDRGILYVATPALLADLGIDPDSISPGTEVLTSLSRADHPTLHLLDLAPREGPPGADPRAEGPSDFPNAEVQRVDLPVYSAAPQSLVTEATMADHGWIAVRAAWLVQSDRAITHDELVAVRRAAAAVGFTVEARDAQDDLATLRTVATGVGVVLALAIVALTLGLLRGESAQDLRTLTATGARARMRRTLTATTAGVLGLVGAGMGAATAYVAMATSYRSDLGQLLPLPVPQLAALLLGVPVLAAAVGWVLSGREPATLSRPLLD